MFPKKNNDPVSQYLQYIVAMYHLHIRIGFYRSAFLFLLLLVRRNSQSKGLPQTYPKHSLSTNFTRSVSRVTIVLLRRRMQQFGVARLIRKLIPVMSAPPALATWPSLSALLSLFCLPWSW